jgi:hypothetical protein
MPTPHHVLLALAALACAAALPTPPSPADQTMPTTSTTGTSSATKPVGGAQPAWLKARQRHAKMMNSKDPFNGRDPFSVARPHRPAKKTGEGAGVFGAAARFFKSFQRQSSKNPALSRLGPGGLANEYAKMHTWFCAKAENAKHVACVGAGAAKSRKDGRYAGVMSKAYCADETGGKKRSLFCAMRSKVNPMAQDAFAKGVGINPKGAQMLSP